MIKERKPPSGISGFPVTPFNENDIIDERGLVKNIEFLLEEGLESIFIACGSGEYNSVSLKEYEKIVRIAVDTVNDIVPVYTGIGGNISEALGKVEISEKYNVDGYLVLPPYLIKGEQEGLYEYYKTIITSSDLNAIIYQRGNAVLQLETLKRIVAFPQVVGLKDGVGDMQLNVELTQTIGNRLGWLNGMPMAEVTMPAYVPLGFNCYSSAISNYLPHISRKFYKALLDNDQVLVNDLYQDVILPINEIRKQRNGYAVSLIKAGMEIIGLPVGNKVRPPIVPVEQEHYKQLRTIIESALVKYPKASKTVN